jgi:hypothetical protein
MRVVIAALYRGIELDRSPGRSGVEHVPGSMNRTSILAVTLLASSLIACVAPDEDTSESRRSEMAPVATFTSRTGTTIELYAMRSGYSAIELGDADLPRALSQHDVATLSPSQVFMDASGTATVPAEVDALTQRLGQTTTGIRPLPPAPVAALNGCSSSSFTAGGYCPSGDVDWCLLNWWNGAYEHIGDLWYSDAYLCVKQGSVLWQISNGEGGFHQWTVSTGQLFHYYLYDGLDSTWLYYDVLQASGDQFQFGGMAYH